MPRAPKLIVSGVAQANTGQTTVFKVPDTARSAVFHLSVAAASGTTPLTDFKFVDVPPKITGAAVVATTSAGEADENEVQTTELSGMVDGTDTVKLTWNGVESTGTITGAQNAAARVVAAQTAIDQCAATFSGYVAGDIVVTEGVDADHQVFTFSGASVTNRDVTAITVTSGAGGASGTVTETNKGVGDERQTITLTGGPTHGTWAILWGGVSADVAVRTAEIPAAATAQQVQDSFNKAAKYTAYGTQPVSVTRTGSGTTGAPYVYTLVFDGTAVANTNVDAVTVDGTKLHTYAAAASNFAGWDGITQIAGTTTGDVQINVGPNEADTTDDTGVIYQVQATLPDKLGAVFTFDRTTGNEIYTYSLYANFTP